MITKPRCTHLWVFCISGEFLADFQETENVGEEESERIHTCANGQKNGDGPTPMAISAYNWTVYPFGPVFLNWTGSPYLGHIVPFIVRHGYGKGPEVSILFRDQNISKIWLKLTSLIYMGDGQTVAKDGLPTRCRGAYRAVCYSLDSDSDCRPRTRSVVRAFDLVLVMSDHGLGPTFCLGLDVASDVGLGPWSEAFDRRCRTQTESVSLFIGHECTRDLLTRASSAAFSFMTYEFLEQSSPQLLLKYMVLVYPACTNSIFTERLPKIFFSPLGLHQPRSRSRVSSANFRRDVDFRRCDNVQHRQTEV
ncbi:hypothetical protein LXL04_030312 [Taraxacum kok-saghyz]